MTRKPQATTPEPSVDATQVVIAGGGVAAVEAALALAELAPTRIATTVVAPNRELVYRPMTVREPFAYAQARRYALAELVEGAGGRLAVDEVTAVDRDRQIVHTRHGGELAYDVLVLALGANARPRYEHAITVDDRCLDDALHGLIQDIEGDYVKRLAFVSPGRMAWPLPLYELALMITGRALDLGVELETIVVTPEDRPLAIFGAAASSAVSKLLEQENVQTLCSAYAEVPCATEVVVNPGDRRIKVDRVIALPELYGPTIRGLPLGHHGFLRVDPHGAVIGTRNIYAAGDATEFPIKHGGIGCQQADAAAEAIASRAGAPIVPHRFHPEIHGILLTGAKPLYLSAHITGGHGFSSNVSDEPTWEPPHKIAARYLAPALDRLDQAHRATTA